jgi:OOP family OmpA-OmpF porin
MAKKARISSIIIAMSFLIAGYGIAAETPQTVFKPYDSSQKINSGSYIQKISKMVVLIDASGSMAHSYKDQVKFDLAMDTMIHMNQTIPDNIKLSCEIRKFGESSALFKEDTIIYKDCVKNSKSGFDKVIQAFPPSTPTILCSGYSKTDAGAALIKADRGLGNDTLENALNAVSKDLEATKGGIALIIISDGKRAEDIQIQTLDQVKDQYKDRLCVYSILVGDDFKGRKFMKQLADKGKCGFTVNADDLASPEKMQAFVEKIFLSSTPDSDGDGVLDTKDKCPRTPIGVPVDEAGCPSDSDNDGIFDYLDKCPDTPVSAKVRKDGCLLDSDGDGIPDYLDQCPQTPQGAAIDKNGCSVEPEQEKIVDSDQDGVTDAHDLCPGTPKGIAVDKDGCPIPLPEKLSINLDIEFNINSSVIDPSYNDEIKKVADIMKAHPEIKVLIEGHTDSTYSEKYNLWLSQRRADKVKQYLVDKFGISPDRLISKGFGESKPIASNSTKEGQKKNRRVIAVISGK